MDDVENSAELAGFVSRRNPETHQEDRELRKLILEAVSRLGATAAQMFALRYFEGFDNGEIARVMNTSALVVGVTLHRARVRLRKEIGEDLQRHSSVGTRRSLRLCGECCRERVHRRDAENAEGSATKKSFGI